jgi:hypothetical protein
MTEGVKGTRCILHHNGEVGPMAGVTNLRRLTAASARELEPEVECVEVGWPRTSKGRSGLLVVLTA